MRHNQEVPVGIHEALLPHRGVGRVVINSDALLEGRLASSADGDESFDKGDFLAFFDVDDWLPPELVGVELETFMVDELRRDFPLSLGSRVLAFDDRRPPLVQPALLVVCPFDGEGCPRQLLCEDPIFQHDWAVLV